MENGLEVTKEKIVIKKMTSSVRLMVQGNYSESLNRGTSSEDREEELPLRVI